MPDWISPDLLTFLGFFGAVAAAAAFGGQWGAGPWYKALSKPSWTPPNWLFPVAWSVLYIMIAVAGWLIWRTPHPDQGLLLGLWVAQLFFNALWSYIFFGRKNLGLALAELTLLWLSIAAFTVLAWPVNQTASLLFAPYLVWVSYAGALNASIWQRNTARA